MSSLAPDDPNSTGSDTERSGSGSDTVRIAREVHPRAVRWMHWINFPLLLIMVWSGLRIYWAHQAYAIGIGRWQWFKFFPAPFFEFFRLGGRLANGIAFHFGFAWLFVINGALFFGYLAWSGDWRHIVPDRGAWRDLPGVLAHDLRLRRSGPPQGKYNAAQKVSYTLVLIMAAILVISGFAIYKPTELYPLPLLFGGYRGARLVHFTMTILVSLFFFVHILQVARAGWNNFRSMITGYAVETVRTETPPASEPASPSESASPSEPLSATARTDTDISS